MWICPGTNQNPSDTKLVQCETDQKNWELQGNYFGAAAMSKLSSACTQISVKFLGLYFLTVLIALACTKVGHTVP